MVNEYNQPLLNECIVIGDWQAASSCQINGSWEHISRCLSGDCARIIQGMSILSVTLEPKLLNLKDKYDLNHSNLWFSKQIQPNYQLKRDGWIKA
jgi:hypothetical protein